MKFTSAFSLLAYAIKVGKTQAEEETCGECLPLPPASKSFQTIRYYNITDPNWTVEQAMEEAAKTIAPQLAKMPGFQRYTAAATGNSQLVLFMNQFASEEEAKAAQDATSDPSSSTHVHNANDDPASVDIAQEFGTLEQDWYNKVFSQTPGFIMSYASANVPAGSDKSVWKILESEADEAAYQALLAENGYEWTGAAKDTVIETIGTIGIDVLCSGAHLTDATDVSEPPPAPAPADDSAATDANPTPAPTPSAGSSASISASVVAVAAAVVML